MSRVISSMATGRWFALRSDRSWRVDNVDDAATAVNDTLTATMATTASGVMLTSCTRGATLSYNAGNPSCSPEPHCSQGIQGHAPQQSDDRPLQPRDNCQPAGEDILDCGVRRRPRLNGTQDGHAAQRQPQADGQHDGGQA